MLPFLVRLQKNCSVFLLFRCHESLRAAPLPQPSPTALFNFCRKHKPQMGLRGGGWGEANSAHPRRAPEWSPLVLQKDRLSIKTVRGGSRKREAASCGGREAEEAPACWTEVKREPAERDREVPGPILPGRVLPLSLRHYGKHDLPSNLLCSTKKCLFEIPPSVIKGAIALQNTIITARLGVALAH